MTRTQIKNLKEKEHNIYIFFNLSKNFGIKRMRPLKPSNIRPGDITLINNEVYILDSIINTQTNQTQTYFGPTNIQYLLNRYH